MALSQESTSQRELHKYSARSRRIGYIFASVWNIFLAFPLYFALAYPRQNILQEIALVLDILLIAPVFLYGSIKLNVLNPRRKQSTVQSIIVLTLLLVLTAGAVFFGENWEYITCFNFFLGCALYILPLRTSVCAAFISLIAFYICAVLGGGFRVVNQYFIIMVIWSAIALLGRYSDNNSVRFAQLKDRISRMEERERAASDIHDLLGQTLTAISLKTQILAASTQDLTVKAGVEEIHDIAVQGIEQMHHTLNQMRSLDLDEEMRQAQLLCANMGITCEIIGSPLSLPQTVRSECAAVLHEGITNILRHSHAHTVRITIDEHEFVIDDDGVGFTQSLQGTGLESLRRRMEGIGAQLYTETSDLGGARVRVVLDE